MSRAQRMSRPLAETHASLPIHSQHMRRSAQIDAFRNPSLRPVSSLRPVLPWWCGSGRFVVLGTGNWQAAGRHRPQVCVRGPLRYGAEARAGASFGRGGPLAAALLFALQLRLQLQVREAEPAAPGDVARDAADDVRGGHRMSISAAVVGSDAQQRHECVDRPCAVDASIHLEGGQQMFAP